MSAAASSRPALRGRPLQRIGVLLRLVQFEHTIFALPFAYSGAVMAARGFPGWLRLWWITLAMAGARSCAFALNRLIDRDIDARNPRTAMRPSVTGAVTARAMLLLALTAAAALLVAAAQLNRLCLALAPLPLALFVVYPYCKRVTWLAHGVLGAGIAGAPVGGWLAVTGSVEVGAVLLGLCVLTWMVGLDIIYALQDEAHDRATGLHSVPARFGRARALLVSDAAHVTTVALLLAAGLTAHMGWPFFAAAAAAAALLAYEHSLVSPQDISRVNRAFFTVNSYFAVVVLVGTAAAVATS